MTVRGACEYCPTPTYVLTDDSSSRRRRRRQVNQLRAHVVLVSARYMQRCDTVAADEAVDDERTS